MQCSSLAADTETFPAGSSLARSIPFKREVFQNEAATSTAAFSGPSGCFLRLEVAFGNFVFTVLGSKRFEVAGRLFVSIELQPYRSNSKSNGNRNSNSSTTGSI